MSEKQFEKNKVTVVIPAYNEERFLRQALESVVEQVDCVLLGDNASTDGTEAICREFAEKYEHIRYIRHDTNIGGVANMQYLVNLVETEYMFHMGAHDLLPDNYVSTLKTLLNVTPDAICAYGNYSWIKPDGTIFRTFDFAPVREKMLDDDPYVRAAAFFHGVQSHLCWLIFGLFRSSTAIPIFTAMKPISGCDHLVPVAALLNGKIVHAPETTYLSRLVHLADVDQPVYTMRKDKNYMKRIVGQDDSKKLSRDYSEIGKQMLDWVRKHREKQDISREQEKTFKKLLFQIKFSTLLLQLRFDTPFVSAFLDIVEKVWRKCFK